jgi:C2H2-type zinc finger
MAQLLSLAKKDSNEKSEQTVKVDNTVVKVKTPPPHRVRPRYTCEECSKLFPSELDLIEHKKIDHSRKPSVAA